MLRERRADDRRDARRQFIKEVLPRLAYANPTVRVDVQFFERGQGQGKGKEVAAATSGEEGETGETEGSDAVSAGSSSSEEASSIEIDFGAYPRERTPSAGFT